LDTIDILEANSSFGMKNLTTVDETGLFTVKGYNISLKEVKAEDTIP
jgi:hypothetical protein